MSRTSQRVLVFVLIMAFAMPMMAQDTPKGLWLKVKCALCHGEDGASDTPTGKKTEAPDLRAPEIQKLSDDELAKLVEMGHAKMPAFKIQLTKDQIKSLVYYIREVGKEAKKGS